MTPVGKPMAFSGDQDHRFRKMRRVTGMRGFAAFYVFLSHLWYEIWPAVPWPQGYGTYPVGSWASWTGWLYYGHFSVVAFIAISGYCLGQKRFPARPTAFTGAYFAYMKRRARRILPPYYAALAICFVLSITLLSHPTGRQWDISIPVAWTHLFANVFLVHDFFEATRINYVFWSIAVEFQLYLLLPFFSRLVDRYGSLSAGISSIAGVYLLIGGFMILGINAIPPQFLDLIAFFLAGLLLARAEQSAHKAWFRALPWGGIAFASLLVLMALCGMLGHQLIEKSFVLADLPCVLLTLSVIMGKKGPFARMMEWAPLVWVGTISYSLYLIHAPLIHLDWLIWIEPLGLNDGMQFLTLSALCIPMVIALSWIFHLVFERPFLSADHLKVVRKDGFEAEAVNPIPLLGPARPPAGISP